MKWTEKEFRNRVSWARRCVLERGLITFYVPDAGQTAKIENACVTYAILSLIYSAINVRYCA
ncbi:hypothetical protein ACVGV7_00725, partial [Enterobacter intestinihominis]